MREIVIITGASSGIAKSTALLLSSKGFKVYAGARHIEDDLDLKKYNIKCKNLDVTDDNSVKEFTKFVLDNEEKIDVLINGAGYVAFGPIEEISIEEAKKQMDVNVFGVVRMCKSVLPIMKKQNSGLIINISAALGKSYVLFSDWYSATKYALEAINDSLRMELHNFKIDIVKIQPGMVDTPGQDLMLDRLIKSTTSTSYEEDVNKIISFYKNSKKTEPSRISNLIYKILVLKKPKTSYLIANDGKMLIFLKKNFKSKSI